ncbi:MAG: hypothetical protein ACOVNU_04080 [Candidatus Kapaibacteriota bacterium]
MEKVFKQLEELGLFKWLDEEHNLSNKRDVTPEYLDNLPITDIHRTVMNACAFRWFRKKYKISCSFDYMTRDSKYYNGYFVHFRGINGRELNKENFIVLNDDLPPTEDAGYGVYRTYEEAELECLCKLIELVKQKP